MFVNLMLLDFSEFNVILRMKWVEKYRAIIYYESKIVTLRSLKKRIKSIVIIFLTIE